MTPFKYLLTQLFPLIIFCPSGCYCSRSHSLRCTLRSSGAAIPPFCALYTLSQDKKLQLEQCALRKVDMFYKHIIDVFIELLNFYIKETTYYKWRV